MLTVTETALDRLTQKLAHKGAQEDTALRFTRRAGGWTLRLDQESKGDTAIAHEGRTVLLLNEHVSKAMADMTLDARKRGLRTCLRLSRNPRCGD
jgi:hypothetical protein